VVPRDTPRKLLYAFMTPSETPRSDTGWTVHPPIFIQPLVNASSWTIPLKIETS